MTRRISIAVGAVLILAVGLLGLRLFGVRMWERTMHGPFYGTPYTGDLTSQPTSSMKLRGDKTIELYEFPHLSVPIAALRKGDVVLWKRVLQPQRVLPDGTIASARIRDARLHKRMFNSSDTRVFFNCDWDWGGREGGLIYLQDDGSFDRFAISW